MFSSFELGIAGFVAKPQILTVLIDNYPTNYPTNHSVTSGSTLALDQFTSDGSQTMFLWGTNWLVCWHVHPWHSLCLRWHCYGCLGVLLG